ncbi:MAG: exo-alpha-sialidase [Caldilineaceae bacterium]|nr:exo-alpha-sialidase [Caldilineaceae bacterium]
MMIHLLAFYKLRLWLPAFLILWFFWTIVVTAAQTPAPANQQGTAAVEHHLYLPAVMNNSETRTVTVTEPLSDDAEIQLPDVATVSSAASMVAVDSTEDYKALGYSDSRKIVRDEAGNLYIAYRKKFNGQYRIFIAKSTDQGRSWTILNNQQPIENIGPYTQRVPSLAIGRSEKEDANFLHVVWYGNDSANPGNQRQIHYLRLTTDGQPSNDGCCVTTFVIDGYQGENLWQEHPTLYVNGSNVYLVWEGRDATNRVAKIKFVRSTDFGRQWTKPLNLQPTTAGHFSRPALAVTYAGDKRQLYVVAYGTNNGLSQVYWSRSLDNGNTWATWQPIAAANVDQRHLSIARDKAGNLHIVWRQLTSDLKRSVLRYRVYNPTLNKGAGNWVSAATTIASPSGQCLFFPSIALDSQDRLWVAWTQSKTCSSLPNDDPTDGQIFYMNKPRNGKWGNPTLLINNPIQLYASFRNPPTPNSESMDVVWLDGSQCAVGAAPLDSKRKEEEADITAPTLCVIRYTTLK